MQESTQPRSIDGIRALALNRGINIGTNLLKSLILFIKNFNFKKGNSQFKFFELF